MYVVSKEDKKFKDNFLMESLFYIFFISSK